MGTFQVYDLWWPGLNVAILATGRTGFGNKCSGRGRLVIMHRVTRICLSVLLLSAAFLAFPQGIAKVKFILRGLNITGQANEPDRPSKSVQRTQYLVFTLGGGVPPWTVAPDNSVVRVEQSSQSVFRIIPNSLGRSVVTVVDSQGGGKYVDIQVIEDRYGTEVVIYRNDNGSSVSGGPRSPTTFTIPVGHKLAAIRTYHYNNGQGKPGGTIMLRHSDGRQFGPWSTSVESRFYWVAKPNASIPPGTFTVIDSDPASWSNNSSSGNAGFVIVNGMPRLPN